MLHKLPGRLTALSSASAALLALAGCSSDSTTGPGPGPVSGPIIETFAGTGVSGLTPDGLSPLDTEFSLPQDLTWGPDGKPYLLDWNNHRVRTIENGVVMTVIGTGELGDAPEGKATEVRLNHPTHVSFDASDRLVLSAWHNSKIMKLDEAGYLHRICGDGVRAFSGDGGLAIDAEVDLPTSTAFAPNGDMYLTDQASVRIRKVGADGIISTVVGIGRPGGYSGDGGPGTSAQLRLPWGQSAPPVGRIAYSGGLLYICDTNNHAVRVYDTMTGLVDTFAGNGTEGFSGDGGPATSAQLAYPSDVDVDMEGNVYIADTFNHRIRRVDTSGMITTYVGTTDGVAAGYYGGDGGPASSAHLDRPYGIAFDSHDDLYIADTHNNRFRVVRR